MRLEQLSKFSARIFEVVIAAAIGAIFRDESDVGLFPLERHSLMQKWEYGDSVWLKPFATLTKSVSQFRHAPIFCGVFRGAGIVGAARKFVRPRSETENHWWVMFLQKIGEYSDAVSHYDIVEVFAKFTFLRSIADK